MELDEGERGELVRLRAENAVLREGRRGELVRARAENVVLREAVKFYKDFITAQAKMSFSAVALPIDLPNEGEQDLPPVLVDLTRAEQVRFEGAGG